MKPTIVCLCGSTKFKEAYEKVTMEESLKDNIVLSVGCFTNNDKIDLNDTEKQRFDDLHKKKIDMADEIIILNVKGYIGESTKSDILYAKESGKLIRYLEDPDWYGFGDEPELGEVELKKEEWEEFSKGINNVFDKGQIKSALINKLTGIIDEKDEKSVKIINMLLAKLTKLAEHQYKEFRKKMILPESKLSKNFSDNNSTWTTYFDTLEIRLISDYISEATSSLSHECLWSIA